VLAAGVGVVAGVIGALLTPVGLLAAALAGAAVIIFPEGTRTSSGRLGELKSGFALLAILVVGIMVPGGPGMTGTFELALSAGFSLLLLSEESLFPKAWGLIVTGIQPLTGWQQSTE
jgi:hypothetical protein